MTAEAAEMRGENRYRRPAERLVDGQRHARPEKSKDYECDKEPVLHLRNAAGRGGETADDETGCNEAPVDDAVCHARRQPVTEDTARTAVPNSRVQQR